ncbi:MAG: ATP-grasp domain-containing protein [Phycisphaerae bacterium]|nr:ATP-grasp domain-containing protein [Phycisphaerae bacterium]
MESFRKAAKQLKLEPIIHGTDSSLLSPGLERCDVKHHMKQLNDPGYLKQLFGVVKKHEIDLIVPTIDTDLADLANNREKLAKIGCRVATSNAQAVHICQDKRNMYKFMIEHGYDTPETMTVRNALLRKKPTWPVLLKPWDGAAGKGVMVAENKQELDVLSKRIKNCMVQEYIKGEEYTCDVYVDNQMQVRCVVPRLRVEVRNGEVSKGRVVKDTEIMRIAAEVIEKLGAGPGVVTLQLIRSRTGEIKIIEINPRFGGGVPLSIKAGANFPKWMLEELIGKKPRIKFDGFTDGLVMLRYDSEVWI